MLAHSRCSLNLDESRRTPGSRGFLFYAHLGRGSESDGWGQWDLELREGRRLRTPAGD